MISALIDEDKSNSSDEVKACKIIDLALEKHVCVNDGDTKLALWSLCKDDSKSAIRSAKFAVKSIMNEAAWNHREKLQSVCEQLNGGKLLKQLVDKYKRQDFTETESIKPLQDIIEQLPAEVQTGLHSLVENELERFEQFLR
jgi:hypothetical protein